jgi:hypothetical protein
VESRANAGYRELPGWDGNRLREWEPLLPNRIRRFRDPPSNRYPEIAERLRAFCRTYDRPGHSVGEQISEGRETIAFIRQRGRRAATRIGDGNTRPK